MCITEKENNTQYEWPTISSPIASWRYTLWYHVAITNQKSRIKNQKKKKYWNRNKGTNGKPKWKLEARKQNINSKQPFMSVSEMLAECGCCTRMFRVLDESLFSASSSSSWQRWNKRKMERDWHTHTHSQRMNKTKWEMRWNWMTERKIWEMIKGKKRRGEQMLNERTGERPI